jgi:hypothetical protein
MTVNDDTRADDEQDMALKARVADEQNAVDALAGQVEGARGLDALATAGEEAWRELKRIDLLTRDFMVHEHWNPAGLEPDPIESTRECLADALAQVKGALAEAWEVDVVQKRLRMAVALARRVLTALDGEIDTIMQHQQDQFRNTGGRDIARW